MNEESCGVHTTNINTAGESVSSTTLKMNAKGEYYWEIKCYSNNEEERYNELIKHDERLRKEFKGETDGK